MTVFGVPLLYTRPTIVLILILLPLAITAQPTDTSNKKDSVFFVKTNMVYTTQSKWLTTFLLDTDPYYHYLETVHDDVNHLQTVITHYMNKGVHPALIDEYRHVTQTHRRDSYIYWYMYQHRLEVFFNRITGYQDILHEIKLLTGDVHKSSRGKRALFSFLGDILSSLTGVASERQVKAINSRINHMAKHDIELAHIVENSISIVNATKIKLAETIVTVNSLVDVTDAIQHELKNVSALLQHEVMNVETLLYRWHQIDSYRVIKNTLETVR